LLPTYKKCPAHFILEVAVGKKKHLDLDDVTPKRVPDYKEFSMKNCYHNIVA